jgi:hypothetical protein
MTHPLVNFVKQQEFVTFLKEHLPSLKHPVMVMQLHRSHQQGHREGLMRGVVNWPCRCDGMRWQRKYHREGS